MGRGGKNAPGGTSTREKVLQLKEKIAKIKSEIKEIQKTNIPKKEEKIEKPPANQTVQKPGFPPGLIYGTGLEVNINCNKNLNSEKIEDVLQMYKDFVLSPMSFIIWDIRDDKDSIWRIPTLEEMAFITYNSELLAVIEIQPVAAQALVHLHCYFKVLHWKHIRIAIKHLKQLFIDKIGIKPYVKISPPKPISGTGEARYQVKQSPRGPDIFQFNTQLTDLSGHVETYKSDFSRYG